MYSDDDFHHQFGQLRGSLGSGREISPSSQLRMSMFDQIQPEHAVKTVCGFALYPLSNESRRLYTAKLGYQGEDMDG